MFAVLGGMAAWCGMQGEAGAACNGVRGHPADTEGQVAVRRCMPWHGRLQTLWVLASRATCIMASYLRGLSDKCWVATVMVGVPTVYPLR
jgi:hypothetical protein